MEDPNRPTKSHRSKKKKQNQQYLSSDHRMMISPVATRNSHFVRPASRGHTVMFRILVGITFLSLTGLLVEVESFHPISPLISATTERKNTQCHHYGFTLNHRSTCHHTGVRAQSFQQKRHKQQSSLVILKAGEDDANAGGGVLESIGLVSQPIVWVSLYFLATTGHGLPAGPGGSIGAIEGLAYLVVVALAVLPTNDGSSLSRTLSRASIALGLLVLATVFTGKGCVPNAKPILDYSAYLPVCGSE